MPFTAEELCADSSEFLLQKQSQVDSTKPLQAQSSSIRLFIAIAAGKIVYGATMHSRHRQDYFAALFQKISANYASAIMQSNSSQQ